MFGCGYILASLPGTCPRKRPNQLPHGSRVVPAWLLRGSRVAATLPRGSRVGPAWLPCGSRVAFVWPRGSHHEGTYLGVHRHVARERERTPSSPLSPHPGSAPPAVSIAQRRKDYTWMSDKHMAPRPAEVPPYRCRARAEVATEGERREERNCIY